MGKKTKTIDLEVEMINFDGKPILDSETKSPIILRTILMNSLMNSPDQDKLSGEDKYKRYDMARRIFNDSKFEAEVEDVALLKKLVGESYGSIIVGQVWNILGG